jgi:hypothetical protein
MELGSYFLFLQEQIKDIIIRKRTAFLPIHLVEVVTNLWFTYSFVML